MGKLYVGNSGSTPAIIKIEEVPKTKFGVSIDNLLGDVDADGAFMQQQEEFVVDGSGLKSIPVISSFISFRAFAYKFYYSSANSFLFPDLEEVYAVRAFDSACSGSYVSNINLTKLRIISGEGAFNNTFQNCNIPNVFLNSLETINASNACNGMFRFAKVQVVELNNLTTIKGQNACTYMFNNCKITSIRFPKLTVVDSSVFGSTSVNGIFSGCTALTEIHFRADMQAMVEAMSGYSAKWGATNATIYFDL